MAKQRRDIMGEDVIYVLYMAVIVTVLSLYAMNAGH